MPIHAAPDLIKVCSDACTLSARLSEVKRKLRKIEFQ